MRLIESRKIKNFITMNAIYIVLILLIIGIAFIDPRFISIVCLRDILIQSSTRVIIALGIFFIILTGGVDLSAGRAVGLAAVITASLLQSPDYLRRFYPDLPQLPLILPILIAVAICLLAGLINGFIVARFGVPPFIATLGMQVIIYGANSIYFDLPPNNSQPIGGLNRSLTELGTGAIGEGLYSLPYIVIIAAVVTVVVWIIANKTQFGKNVYAIGGNVEAARVSGINIGKNLMVVYAMAGALYGLAGVLEAGRTGGATNNYGTGYELDAIAACVVGGVSATGGIGKVPGVLAGVLIFSVINYGLTFINVNPYWQMIIKGLIIVAAVAFDIRKYRRRK
ncbi:galactose/methyl galactoside ABC transporter permease MglC [Capillibacterium thermochitinicola]|uniref:Galactose/methyl galactoside ABC transporter permease MglC n=1 Tax=Capillibacterium thermochitinicola TaxID=2699427 RepID=A0A8J6LN40_9FIRM|nr:galactose/methyl galactoside ABC transporter permease MglC [Capillibacterium thermochitinicola]MBA2133533.1 galactose/methyl galactoside ABC transporter permease MglC [Capillibacterium thermochitinicola]